MPREEVSSASHGDGRNGDIGLGFGMLGDDLPEIHPIKLVAAEDQEILPIVIQEVEHVLADSVGRALVPGSISVGLFGRQDLDEPTGEMIELIGLGDVPVQGRGVELGEQINPAQARVDAIGNGYIDQTIFAGQRHGRLGAFLSEREQAASLPSAHNHRQNVARIN